MAARVEPTGGIWVATLAILAAIVGLLAGVNPKLAIAAAVGAGFVLIVFVDLARGLALFGFFGFLEVFELGGAVSVGKLGGLLLVMGWLAVLATRNGPRGDFFSAHQWMTAGLGLFLGWALLSAAWSGDSGAALSETMRLALNVVLFLIVFTAVRTKRQAVMVTGAFVCGAIGATVYGLLHASPATDAGRLTGAGLDPNELAAALVAGAALAAGLAVCLRRSPAPRFAALAGGGFCLLGVFLTVSRGGIVALSVALLAAIAFGGRWRPRILVVGVLVVAAAFAYFGAVASPQARERITSATQGEAQGQSGRPTLWTVAWRMVEAKPLTGVGAGNFQDAAKSYLLRPGSLARSDLILEQTPKVAHNTYLGMLAQLGVVGLALFLSILGFSLVSSLRAAGNFRKRGDPGGEALSRAFAVALIGTLAADFFISQELSKQLWLLLGFGPALLSLSTRCAPHAEQAE